MSIIVTTLQIQKKERDSEWLPSFPKRDPQLIGGVLVE